MDPTALDEEVDTSDPKLAIANTIERIQWASAAKHYAGKGLEDGADLHSAGAMLRKYKSKGNYDSVGALLAIFAGGVWPRQRVADLGLEIDDVMRPRCGEEPETWEHRMWKCKCNKFIE